MKSEIERIIDSSKSEIVVAEEKIDFYENSAKFAETENSRKESLGYVRFYESRIKEEEEKIDFYENSPKVAR